MFVNKMGAQHLDYGKNCQDYGLEKDCLKVVCDGCSEGAHSEVGAKAYCHLAASGYDTDQIFQLLMGIFGQSPQTVREYLCFTILEVAEQEDSFCVTYCGDGYILLQDAAGEIQFMELSDGAYPKYYAYNYCDASSLRQYQDGVPLNRKVFHKKEYQKVGIASDGLRYIVNSKDTQLKAAFTALLKLGSAVKIKRFINCNQRVFQDDITIVF